MGEQRLVNFGGGGICNTNGGIEISRIPLHHCLCDNFPLKLTETIAAFYNFVTFVAGFRCTADCPLAYSKILHFRKHFVIHK